MAILVTGGAGFIGSNFILNWLKSQDEQIINLDKLTYAGNLHNLSSVQNDPHYIFVQGSIGNRELVRHLLHHYKIRAVINFAAETHVDRSIHSPESFIETNLVETFNLIETCYQYWQTIDKDKNFRFLHVSTDEVYGTLEHSDPPISETNPYKPNSPYSASKAGSDHLIRAYYHTYGLPVLTTNCSNNYGPYQFPEKLIPLLITNALNKKILPIYGDGLNIRDWLYVEDHCEAIKKVLFTGKTGEAYNVGGLNEKTNIDVAHIICNALDELKPKEDGSSYRSQIIFIQDRAGHDKRYAINADKIRKDTNWKPSVSFELGIKKTIHWYLNNYNWIENITNGEYKSWIAKQYA